MDFSLSNEQRAWQMTARKFAQEEIKPISLELDDKPDALGSFDWDIEKNSTGMTSHIAKNTLKRSAVANIALFSDHHSRTLSTNAAITNTVHGISPSKLTGR